MSEHDVDLSSIRGDWNFHFNYLMNAVEKTQKYQMKLWRQINAARDAKGILPAEKNELIAEYLEAVRMTHSFTDDFIMMLEQRPAKAAKKKTKKKATKKAKKKVAKKASKKASKKVNKKAKKKARR